MDDKMVHRTSEIKEAWQTLTQTDAPDGLFKFIRDIDTVVKFISGSDAALRSSQVTALGIIMYWRMNPTPPQSEPTK